MENIGEIIPFAKEMLTQRPSRSLLKIYLLGSTLAILGMVGGLVEMAFMPFVERDSAEDEPAELIIQKKKEKNQVLKSHSASADIEVVDVMETVMPDDKAKYLLTSRRRSSANRLHAS
ncbi:G0/G1 switch protein 2 [Archocentrus centrarchus]|uniref:G0/G1 switch protein 2 n=1 Tax=Archocentrus centrarchus TaxID=63155 RepID=UPI0011E9E0FC|nr:G0/G1 switch protein 2 [Archocentrus centrarchus]XP_030589753.1 G0/G1 switch protein 2 [Archocentrus centrarchus]